jgi:hypothetical protein
VLPWAVTANLAVANSPTTFDLRFPKTGGGEDIDYCLKATTGRLLPVPQVRYLNQCIIEVCQLHIGMPTAHSQLHIGMLLTAEQSAPGG